MSKPHSRWRIGLIGDIHGNVVALQAVLAALQYLGMDQLICLGDVATSGPNPCEAVALLRDLACPTVMGNTDEWTLNPYPFAYRNAETPIIYGIELWGAEQLDDVARTYLRTFTPTVELTVGTTTLLAYHGSPRSNLEDIRATTPDADLDEIFANHPATIAIGGHTHTQMVRRYRDMLIVNPGSVGAPVAYRRGESVVHSPPWAEFGVLEIAETAQGPTLQVQLHRTPIDVKAVIASAHASGMPYADWYVARWQRGLTAP